MSGSDSGLEEPDTGDATTTSPGRSRTVPVVLWETLMLTLIASVIVLYGLYNSAAAVQRSVDQRPVELRPDELGLWERVFAHAAALGDAALDNVGWALGIFLPTVLGFFVLVIGEEWAFKNNPTRVSHLRALLANAAQIFSACTLTAFTLIIVHWTQDPAELGAILFIVPAVLVLVGLGVGLGTFAVPERSVAIKAEEQTIAWAQKRLDHLPEAQVPAESDPQSPASETFEPAYDGPLPTAMAIFTTSLVGGIIGTLIAVERNEWDVAGAAMAIFTVCGLFFSSSGAYQRYAWFMARDRADRFFSTLLALLSAAFGAAVTWALIDDGLIRMGIAVLSTLLVSALSSFVVPTRITSDIYRWSVQRSVVRAAKSVLDGKLAKSQAARDKLQRSTAE